MTTALVSFTRPAQSPLTWYKFWRHFARHWWGQVDRWIVIDNGCNLPYYLLPFDTQVVTALNADVGKLALKYVPQTGKLLCLSEATLVYEPKIIEEAIKRDEITSACDATKQHAVVSEQPLLAVTPVQWLDLTKPDLSLAISDAYERHPHHGLVMDTSFATLNYKHPRPNVIKKPTGFYFVAQHLLGSELINRFDPAQRVVVGLENDDLSVSDWRSIMWWYIASQQASYQVQPIIEMVEAYMPVTRWINYHRRHLQAHPWLKPSPAALKP